MLKRIKISRFTFFLCSFVIIFCLFTSCASKRKKCNCPAYSYDVEILEKNNKETSEDAFRLSPNS